MGGNLGGTAGNVGGTTGNLGGIGGISAGKGGGAVGRFLGRSFALLCGLNTMSWIFDATSPRYSDSPFLEMKRRPCKQ